jgi:hypothetical protein
MFLEPVRKLGLRMVGEMLAARSIVVSHETVRQWALKFGQGFANEIRRRLPVATHNDVRPDARFKALLDAHSLRRARASGARYLGSWPLLVIVPVPHHMG